MGSKIYTVDWSYIMATGYFNWLWNLLLFDIIFLAQLNLD